MASANPERMSAARTDDSQRRPERDEGPLIWKTAKNAKAGGKAGPTGLIALEPGLDFAAMTIVRTPMPLADIDAMAKAQFGDLVKAVVDVERGVMAVGGELHSDEEALLLEDGSKQRYLWGINLFPEVSGEDWFEFDSMINIRPSQGNRSRGVDDAQVRAKIVEVVRRLVKR